VMQVSMHPRPDWAVYKWRPDISTATIRFVDRNDPFFGDLLLIIDGYEREDMIQVLRRLAFEMEQSLDMEAHEAPSRKGVKEPCSLVPPSCQAP